MTKEKKTAPFWVRVDGEALPEYCLVCDPENLPSGERVVELLDLECRASAVSLVLDTPDSRLEIMGDWIDDECVEFAVLSDLEEEEKKNA